jgi:hypothetical protein
MHQITSTTPDPTILNDCTHSTPAPIVTTLATQRLEPWARVMALAARTDSPSDPIRTAQLSAQERMQRLVAARSHALPGWLIEAETNDALNDGEDWIVRHQFDESDCALNGRRYAARRKAMTVLDAMGQAALRSKRPEDVDAIHDIVSFLSAATYRTARFGLNQIASACVFLPPPNAFAVHESLHGVSKTFYLGAPDFRRTKDGRQYGFGVTHEGSLIVDIVPRKNHTHTNAADQIRTASSHEAVWKILDTIGYWQVSESSAIVSPLPRSVATFAASPRSPYTNDWIASLSALLRSHRSNIEALGFGYRHVKRWATQMLRANLSVNIFREIHESLDQRLLTAMCHSPAVLSVAGHNALSDGYEEDIAPITWQSLFDEPLTISVTLEAAKFDKASRRIGSQLSRPAVVDRKSDESVPVPTVLTERNYTELFAAALTNVEDDPGTREHRVTGSHL